jgi:hypothetical protein
MKKSLNERAISLGLAIDIPSINRATHRRDLKISVREEYWKRKRNKKDN